MSQYPSVLSDGGEVEDRVRRVETDMVPELGLLVELLETLPTRAGLMPTQYQYFAQ